MIFKPGVILGDQLSPHLVLAMWVADQTYRAHLVASECVITSVADGKHGTNSLHYKGRAIDLRTREIPPGVRPALFAELRGRLRPIGFDVIDEGDHFHVEYDPHPTAPGAVPPVPPG